MNIATVGLTFYKDKILNRLKRELTFFKKISQKLKCVAIIDLPLVFLLFLRTILKLVSLTIFYSDLPVVHIECWRPSKYVNLTLMKFAKLPLVLRVF